MWWKLIRVVASWGGALESRVSVTEEEWRLCQNLDEKKTLLERVNDTAIKQLLQKANLG